MKTPLVGFGLLFFLISGAIFITGSSAVHEIEAAIFLLISAVLIVGAAIIDAIQSALVALGGAFRSGVIRLGSDSRTPPQSTPSGTGA